MELQPHLPNSGLHCTARLTRNIQCRASTSRLAPCPSPLASALYIVHSTSRTRFPSASPRQLKSYHGRPQEEGQVCGRCLRIRRKCCGHRARRSTTRRASTTSSIWSARRPALLAGHSNVSHPRSEYAWPAIPADESGPPTRPSKPAVAAGRARTTEPALSFGSDRPACPRRRG